MSEFSERFAMLRHENGISQRKVAQDLGISQALLSHYENGLREPRLEFVAKICDYYGVSADYLLGRTELRDNPAFYGEPENWNVERLMGLTRNATAVLAEMRKLGGENAEEEATQLLAETIYRLWLVISADRAESAVSDAMIRVCEAKLIAELAKNAEACEKAVKKYPNKEFETFVRERRLRASYLLKRE